MFFNIGEINIFFIVVDSVGVIEIWGFDNLWSFLGLVFFSYC